VEGKLLGGGAHRRVARRLAAMEHDQLFEDYDLGAVAPVMAVCPDPIAIIELKQWTILLVNDSFFAE
jgi:hypothetical protein